MVHFTNSNRLWIMGHSHHRMFVREPKEDHRMNRFLLALAIAAPLWAQSNPMSTEVKRDYKSVRDYFIRAVEKMPETDYGFKPSPDVRSFGQQVAHVADDQYNLCAPAKGETRNAAYRAIEQSLSTKSELVAALKAAFAYCDGAYEAITHTAGTPVVARP